jgi:hypothetical protein
MISPIISILILLMIAPVPANIINKIRIHMLIGIPINHICAISQEYLNFSHNKPIAISGQNIIPNQAHITQIVSTYVINKELSLAIFLCSHFACKSDVTGNIKLKIGHTRVGKIPISILAFV